MESLTVVHVFVKAKSKENMTSFLSLVCLVLLYTPNILSVPVKVNDEATDPYRLPKTVIPSHFNIHLVLDKDIVTGEAVTLKGTVDITLKVTENVPSISFHVHPDFINITKITFGNAGLDNLKMNETTQIYELDTPEAISVGIDQNLAIEFDGLLSTTEMYGFYRSQYVTNEDVTKYLVTTQFEPTHARRAFPCFDEPSFKAKFDISISYPTDKNLTPLGNTLGTTAESSGTTTVTFETTPTMSTYLIAFTISEFTSTESTGNAAGVPHKVWSQNGTEDTRKWAVQVGPLLLQQLDLFTGIPYKDNMKKMDQVAIPDFAAGAMENWGLVTYRETALLWDENESSNRYQQRVTTVIAHEFAHMWFGDLVTLDWWSETFLNEGFATYFEYHIANKVNEAWELTKQFVLEQLQTSLAEDALSSSLALQSSCSTPAEIEAKFDTISYNKGGSVLRMVEHMIGTENFKTGLNKYLTARSGQTAVPEQLWEALGKVKINETDVELTDVMESWVKNAGFPLITVKMTGTEVEIQQERFLLPGSDASDTTWFVPISYTTSNEKDFDNTAPKVWLTSDDKSIIFDLTNSSDWIIVNIQETGYYRVNYDDSLWSKIKTALQSDNFDEIADLNRAQIVDDVFSLLKIGKIDVAQTFELLKFLENDIDYYPWYPAFNGFSNILQKVSEDSAVNDALSGFVLDLMDNLYQSVANATDPDQVSVLRRALAYSWACQLGNGDCTQMATSKLEQYRKSSTKPDDINLRSTIYCYGLKNSKTSEDDWEFLWNEFKISKLATEKITLLSALGCTENEDLLKHYLDLSVSDDSDIRPQDALSVFQAVYTSSSKGLSVAFDFLTANYTLIQTKYASMNSLGTLITGIADRFTTQTEVDKLTTFVNKDDLPEQIKVVAQKALESAKANIKWISDFKSQLDDYFNLNPIVTTTEPNHGSGNFNISVFSLILIALCTYLFNFR